MSIFPHRIEIMIDKLESSIPYVSTGPIRIGKTERHDWRPIWNLCKDIQKEFKGCRDFPSREAQQAAWNRFQEVRQKASALCDAEKENFRDQSSQLRDLIVSEAKSCRWSALGDVLFFFDPTTVEEIKQMSTRLKAAGRMLSENKQWMLAEHKAECFERIQEARESHDAFWAKRRELSQERRAATQRRRDEHAAKQEAWRQRVRENLDRNREKLRRAEDALDRTRDRIREIEGKLYETTSDKWSGIFSEWLSEAQAKERDIEDSIDRIRGWIREDEDKL